MQAGLRNVGVTIDRRWRHDLRMSSAAVQRRKALFIAWMEVNGLNVNRVAKAAGVSPTTLYSYVDDGPKATKVLGASIEDKIARAFDLPVEAIFGPLWERGEVPLEHNKVAIWREYRRMSQVDLAAALSTTITIVQMLEAGEIPLSQKWLERLALAFTTKAPWVMLDPTSLARDVLDAVEIKEEDREQVLRILDTFRGSATA